MAGKRSTQDIAILGIGGFGREMLVLIKDINIVEPKYNILGFIDDDQTTWGKTVNGQTVLGGREFVDSYSKANNSTLGLVLGIGNPATKAALVADLQSRATFPSLVHPSVLIGDEVLIEAGVVITAGNILTCNIHLMPHCTINLNCTIGHDSTIGSFTLINPGACISGNVTIADGVLIGTGATVLEGRKVGAWAKVGGGALVNKDVPEKTTVVGVPALPLNKDPMPGKSIKSK